MPTYPLTPTCSLIIEQGDLTESRVDAIVNAANELLLGGGGVDAAVHDAAGPELLEACRAIPEVSPGIRCPTGEARITPGFRLPARYIIHTVGPVFSSTEESAPLLEAAHRSSLQLANDQGLRSLAFPAISCGVFGYPLELAASLALYTCRDHAGSLTEIRFVLFSQDVYDVWVRAAQELLVPLPSRSRLWRWFRCWG
jgi:O-acetyl-ADP-ribose deacetylase (regulator of RNase III)